MSETTAPLIEANLPTTVGFEIEFSSTRVDPLYDLAVRMDAEKIKNVKYGGWRKTTPGEAWDLKLDSSCGYEAAGPIIRTYADLVKHAKVAAMAAEVGEFNNRCGFHVHVGVKSFPDSSLYHLLKFCCRFEEAFFRMAPGHRRKNNYCAKFGPSYLAEFKEIESEEGEFRRIEFDRSWANFQNVRNSRETVEFRIMGGVINPQFVIGWVSFVSCLTNYILTSPAPKVGAGWTRAKYKDQRILFANMLQQAGFYSKKQSHPELAKAARQWAMEQFNEVNDE